VTTTLQTISTAHTILPSPLGELTVVRDDDALVGLYFPDHWRQPDPFGRGPRTDHGFDDAATQLDEYFAGQRQAFDLPLKSRGDPFQQSVWQLLRQIPFGQTVTYGELAGRLGAGAQQVGRAVGGNPLSIFVPCHRVVGQGGKLTGYAGGLQRKRLLLELEAHMPPALDVFLL
jgi:methylated-DNA-[protein]-cysteine S-methyltransferase